MSVISVHLLTLLRAGRGLDLAAVVTLDALIGPSQRAEVQGMVETCEQGTVRDCRVIEVLATMANACTRCIEPSEYRGR